MKKRHLLFAQLPKYVLLTCSMMTVGMTEAYSSPAPAQQSTQSAGRTVTGTVFDENGEPVIGASVVVKGGTAAAATDADGKFTIRTNKPNVVLTVSYVGYSSKEVAVRGDKPVSVTLDPSTSNLDEVVVTALGIKRQAKALGYAVQDMKGDLITEARETNLVNALSGRFAGVNVTGTGNGNMGSSNIVIRGNNSISGNNQPLIVVDGIPMDNSSGTSGWSGGYGVTDNGNGLSDLNTDDIEDISVLKGAAAAALYGTRAGNGVVMITTKSGTKRKGLGVTFNSNYMFERPLCQFDLQNEFGQGTQGEMLSGEISGSWGARMQGQDFTDWTGKTRPYLPWDNNMMDYLRTGFTTNQTLEVGFNSEKGSFITTVGYEHIRGIVPSSYQNKVNINMHGSVNLTSRLKFSAKANYIKRDRHNNPELGGSGSAFMNSFLEMPRSIHISDMKPIYDENGKVLRWIDHSFKAINPYIIEENEKRDKRDRFLGFLELSYDITDWLSAKVRHGEDFYWSFSDSKTVAAYPVQDLSGNVQGHGRYTTSDGFFRERNSDFLITLHKDNLIDEFSASLSFGGNMMHRYSRGMSVNSGALEIPDWFYINNGTQITTTPSFSEKSVNSLYGLAQLSYGNWIFVDVTGRNDWSSTLPRANRSFFYPSVGVGWIVTDMLSREFGVQMPTWLSYGKARFSYAEVGNDTGPYQLVSVFNIKDFLPGIKHAWVSEVAPLLDLKPENIKSYEAGFDVRFFNNRLGVDFTWYKKNATNQILNIPISKTSGFSSRLINAGSIENQGVEIIISATPVQLRDFTWNTSVNFAKNSNKINELHPEIDYKVLGSYGVQVVAKEGGFYGDMFCNRYQRTEDGRVIVDQTGLPLIEQKINYEESVGNYQPKWTGSWYNSFRWRDFTLGFMLDMRYGGNVYLSTVSALNTAGNSVESLKGRDEWYAGTGGLIVDGVVQVGNDDNGKPIYEENTKYVNPQDFYSRKSAEDYVYDATCLRLRELTLGYTMPGKVLAHTPFTGLKVTLVGRNLWIIHKKTPKGFDPESVVSSGNVGGIEYGSLPTMRSFGFNVNLSF